MQLQTIFGSISMVCELGHWKDLLTEKKNNNNHQEDGSHYVNISIITCNNLLSQYAIIANVSIKAITTITSLYNGYIILYFQAFFYS